MYKQSDADRKLFVLSLSTVGQTYHLGKKGVMIVFTDSTRWERKTTPIMACTLPHSRNHFLVEQTLI